VPLSSPAVVRAGCPRVASLRLARGHHGRSARRAPHRPAHRRSSGRWLGGRASTRSQSRWITPSPARRRVPPTLDEAAYILVEEPVRAQALGW